MHKAVENRLAKLIARGIDPGADTGVERKVGTATVHDFEFCQAWAYPGQDEAWFYPDVEHLARFLRRPG
jgi:hypothetical protein